METKKDMGRLTDLLLGQVDDYSKKVLNKLEQLDIFVQDGGKELIDETYNDVKNIQFKVKDFQQVYNIAENKFSPNWEKVNVKSCMDTIIDQAKHDVKGNYMDLTILIDKDVPETIKSDLTKIKQVILNLFNQSVIGQSRGFVKFHVSNKIYEGVPSIAVTMENSKFSIKPKDAQVMNRMSQQTTFQMLLQAKVDVNLKVAKILSNALSWAVDFNNFRSGKQTIYIPITNEKTKASDTTPIRDATPVYNDTNQLTVVHEERQATVSQLDGSVRNESYPLRQPGPNPEVLLVSYSDLKPVFETKIGYKCLES